MESVDLRCFEVVAETKNLTRAAQILNTVQSNVTKRIKRLEDELGTELLSRHSRGVSLTESGEALFPFAVRTRQIMEDAASSVGTRQSKKVSGILRIGSLETVAAVRLPSILIRYAELFPNVEVVLRTGTSRELRDQVLDHKLDGAFVGGRTGQESLEESEMWNEEVVLVGSSSFRGKVSLSGMSEVRILVFRTGCSYRSYIEAFLTNLGVNAIRQIELGTLEGILGCVSAGLGITMLPKSVIDESVYRTKLSTHRLTGQHSIVPTVFVRRANSYVSAAMTQFMGVAALAHKNGNKKKASAAIAS
ncbi:MAG TPA: LysR family transcriptional regulator [Candidatus Angelobacter sp.]|nr:LysR family transcriptional regulator [Candidatus Angelobacter sp.]